MKSFQPFPNARLKPGGRITKQFLTHGITDFQSAAHHVHQLPYGINTDRTDIRLVLSEGQGTCSTKHALLSQLAREQGLEVSLMIGIFKMTASNTPGVGPVLAKYGLSYLPEAHCYLMFQGRRVDLTHSGNTLGEPIDRFLYERDNHSGSDRRLQVRSTPTVSQVVAERGRAAQQSQPGRDMEDSRGVYCCAEPTGLGCVRQRWVCPWTSLSCLAQLHDDLFCRKPPSCHPCLLPKPKILTFKLDSF